MAATRKTARTPPPRNGLDRLLRRFARASYALVVLLGPLGGQPD